MKHELEYQPAIFPSIFPSAPNWQAYFGNDHPLELELGMGRSHFLFERAASMPAHNIVGIEWKQRWVEQANRKIVRESINNVCALHGNAWLLLPALFAPNTLSNIVLNFPDPWWKKKHQKRRIVNDVFVNILASRLAPQGTLFLQTDVGPLFEEYTGRLKAHPDLKYDGPLLHNPMNAQSHREKKCESVGIPIYRALLTKEMATS